MHINSHASPFEEELCALVSQRGYTAEQLISLIRVPDEELTEEGRWIKMICVQASIEHIEAQA